MHQAELVALQEVQVLLVQQALQETVIVAHLLEHLVLQEVQDQLVMLALLI